MDYPKLYRKRLIPSECIELHDTLHHYADDIIVTSWSTIRPKKDLHHGESCYYINEGWKISRFYKEDNSLMYVYCDIVTYESDSSDNTLVVKDLLADVVIYPDGFIKVVDLDELSEAFNSNLISSEELSRCLTSLNNLLNRIYAGELPTLISPIDVYTK